MIFGVKILFTKNSVRKMIFSRLKRLRDLKAFERQNSALNLRLKHLLRNRSGIWAAFMPLALEPNLTQTYQDLSDQILFAFPKIQGDEIHFYVPAKEHEFQKGQFGIHEPDHQKAQRVFASQMTGVIVPGVAFDSTGARIGRGRGFYDRFLSKCKAEKIGVCFQSQLLNEKIKTQNHDQAIDRLVTENFSLNFSKFKNLAQSLDFSGFSERKFI